MQATKSEAQKPGLTLKIMAGLSLGIVVGLLLHNGLVPTATRNFIIHDVFDTGGKLFLAALKMLVVPIVFISLVCGTCKLGDAKRFGRMALQTIFFYVLTTALAITLALVVAHWVEVGTGANLVKSTAFQSSAAPGFKDVVIGMIPENPIQALATGNMLQVLIFAVLFGLAILWAGERGKRVAALFDDLNVVIMKLMWVVIAIAPYGIFCLVAKIFSEMGFSVIEKLLAYFLTVLLVLVLQLALVYPLLLSLFARFSPRRFYQEFFPAMLFAFSTSSSNASIPIVLDTVEKRLHVRNRIAAFVIPLGATINMDGTAIMQGVATVFIANAYNVDLGLTGYMTVIMMATLASIGTAGVPGVGLITLTMVLRQLGLPTDAIALIIGVDRLLDMVRTAVNVSGDATIARIMESRLPKV